MLQPFDIVDKAAIYNERVAIILGFITLVSAIAAFVSCRTFMNILAHLGLKNASQSRFFQRYYRYHAWYWWVFGVALLTHLVIATVHTGLPKAGDPDAPIHWAILALGLAGGLTGITLFFSCRIVPRLMAPATDKFSLQNRAFNTFFKYHTWYWLVFVLLVAAHFTVSFIHAGAWPQ